VNVFSLILLLIGVTYGGITILGAAVQIKQDKLNWWSILIMIIGALLVILSVVCGVVLGYDFICLLIAGLLLIHVAAINNGFKMYGKVHFKHHAARLMISLFIITFYFKSW
jgi:membrane-bound ClpP family serine protease